MSRSSTFLLFEARVSDRYDLPSEMRRWRSAGVSAEAIARLLEMDTGMSISGETVRRWMRVLDAVAA